MRVCSVFLRAVYTLGESLNSPAILFRTSSRGEDDVCLLDNSASKEGSSRLGCISDFTAVQLTGVRSVDSRVGGTGDDGRRTVPARQMLRETDVRPVRTYPLSTRTPVEEVVKGHLDCLQRDGSGDALARTKTESEDCRLNVGTAAVEVRSHSDSESRFVPKPPDESAVPRRNSFSRRGSLRRRADSGSSQHGESKVSHEAGAVCQEMSAATNLVSPLDSSAANTGSLTSETTLSASINVLANVQSSSKSSPEDLAKCESQEPTPSECRSSSLREEMKQPHNTEHRTTVTDKPPRGRLDSSRDHDSPPHTEDVPLEKRSDKTDTKAVLKNSSQLTRIPQPKQDSTSVHKMKKLFAHKR